MVVEGSPGMVDPVAEELDLIAVGAHPDDVEIACGGTLAHLARRGYRVGIVDLTDGEPTPLSPGPDVRLHEAQRAAEILGVVARINLNLPNRRLLDGFEARLALARVFRRYRPRLVIGFGGKTVLASPDHYQAMLITDAAVFYSRLSKWDEYFDDLPAHTITNQLSFPISLHNLAPPEESAGYVVADIGDTLDIKLESIRAFRTQFPASKARIFAAVESMNRYHGMTAGFEAGELFLTYRTIGVEDLMQWAAPPRTAPGV
jgi:LmbE family N-acetylglucosaminyl deacetylase